MTFIEYLREMKQHLTEQGFKDVTTLGGFKMRRVVVTPLTTKWGFQDWRETTTTVEIKKGSEGVKLDDGYAEVTETKKVLTALKVATEVVANPQRMRREGDVFINETAYLEPATTHLYTLIPPGEYYL